MKLLDYIRGARKGKEAHRLEKEAMRDPFWPTRSKVTAV